MEITHKLLSSTPIYDGSVPSKKPSGCLEVLSSILNIRGKAGVGSKVIQPTGSIKASTHA